MESIPIQNDHTSSECMEDNAKSKTENNIDNTGYLYMIFIIKITNKS